MVYIPGNQATLRVMYDVEDERQRQDAKWGEQNHPDGKKPRSAPFANNSSYQRGLTDRAARDGRLNWQHILREEVAEAFDAIGDDKALREELIQVAAVVVAWIEAIDRRGK